MKKNTFKNIMVGFLRIPSAMLGGLSALIFGFTKNHKEYHGLFSAILAGVIATGRGITNLIRKNRDTIATAFWLSALAFGAAALTVFLWPAALTAITTFPILGFTLGALIANPAFQILAIGGIAATATSVLTYTTAALTNGIKALINACKTEKPAQNTLLNIINESKAKELEQNDSNDTMNEILNNKPAANQRQNATTTTTTTTIINEDTNPTHNVEPGAGVENNDEDEYIPLTPTNP